MPHLLVVDDDLGMVATLSDILQASGYSVETATDGLEATEWVRAHERAPDCILMDIRMPGVNGVDAFREIKRLAPECRVIFMTAYSNSGLVDEARDEGAVDVLPKPLDLERLLRLVEEVCGGSPQRSCSDVL